MLKKLLCCLLLATAVVGAAEVETLTPAQAAARVADGQAILIDVREAAEWKQTGVAAPANLLAKSDFDAAKSEWTPFLEKVGKDKTLILYCRSGKRSGAVAEALAKQGFKVANAGGFQAWADAGLPTRKVE